MQQIASKFLLKGSITGTTIFGSGHINASYRVDTKAGEYLLQRINHNVFPDIAGLSNNIQFVTEHIRKKIALSEGEAGQQLTLMLVPTLTGKQWYQDTDGSYWRMFDFLDGLVSYDLVETPEQAYAGARSYGYFLSFLADYPANRLVSVLPDFHNVISRLKAFQQALSPTDGRLKKRAVQCQPEIRKVLNMADEFAAIQQAWDRGVLPTRVTHNDTKFNNVLLSPEGQGRAVIDLDTVMPGIVHFDYGDGIRTATATAAEDEADLKMLEVDPEKYQAFTEGYLSTTRDLLTPAELHYLPLSGALLAYIMAVRFLTDYLRGDTYYKIAYPDHNLFRGLNQLRLAELLKTHSAHH